MKWEDYKNRKVGEMIDSSEWDITNIECPECGKKIYMNIRYILTSYPPQHYFRCFKCDWHGTA